MTTVFIDCGAHTGESIPRIKATYGKATRIVCYEPVPSMANHIYREWKNDQLVTVICAAVSTSDRTIRLRMNQNSCSATISEDKIMPGEDGYILVRVIDLISAWPLAAHYGGCRVVLKLDVEGEEYTILRELCELNMDDCVDELWVEWHRDRMVGGEKLADVENSIIDRFGDRYKGDWKIQTKHIPIDREEKPLSEVLP